MSVDASEHDWIPTPADVVDETGDGLGDEEHDGTAGDGHGGTVSRGTGRRHDRGDGASRAALAASAAGIPKAWPMAPSGGPTVTWLIESACSIVDSTVARRSRGVSGTIQAPSRRSAASARGPRARLTAAARRKEPVTTSTRRATTWARDQPDDPLLLPIARRGGRGGARTTTARRSRGPADSHPTTASHVSGDHPGHPAGRGRAGTCRRSGRRPRWRHRPGRGRRVRNSSTWLARMTRTPAPAEDAIGAPRRAVLRGQRLEVLLAHRPHEPPGEDERQDAADDDRGAQRDVDAEDERQRHGDSARGRPEAAGAQEQAASARGGRGRPSRRRPTPRWRRW